jgi:hypothetical protein
MRQREEVRDMGKTLIEILKEKLTNEEIDLMYEAHENETLANIVEELFWDVTRHPENYRNGEGE